MNVSALRPLAQEVNGAPILFFFTFLILSAAHLEIRGLADLNLEVVSALLIALFLVPSLYFSDKSAQDRVGLPIPLALCVFLIATPLLSSFLIGDRLDVLLNPEFRSWAKALLVLPAMPWILRKQRAKEGLIDCALVAIAVFAGIVLYRFYVLGEMRESDLRPKVNVKNGDPNFICVLVAVAIPLVLYKIAVAVKQATSRWLFLYVPLLVLFGLTVTVTESRMGILSLFVGLVVLVALTPFQSKRTRRTLIGLVALASLAPLAVRDIGARFRSLNDDSNRERVKSLVAGSELFAERPLTGFGWGSSPRYYYSLVGHERLRSEERPLAVHNTFLQLAAELGTLGLASFTSLFFLVGAAIRRGLREKRYLAAFAASAFVILGMNLLTLPLYGKDFVLWYLGALLSLVSGESA